VAKLGGGPVTAFVFGEPTASALGEPEPVTEADEADPVAVAYSLDALEMMESASPGEIVDVVVLAEAELLPVPVRTNWLSISTSVSIKAIVGPATTELVAC